MKLLRKVLGWLCILLAPLCVGFGFLNVVENGSVFWYSISATYYASSKMWMIGLLFSAGITFLCYKGYDKVDDILTTISGLTALGVVTFPCNTAVAGERVGLFNLPVGISNTIHCICAAVLFISFAVMIWFQFPKSSGDLTGKKRARNIVYKTCAIVIFVFMLSQVLTSAIIHLPWMTVINEFFMLTAFGVAWLTKGEQFKFLND